jgi:hypothetical protein
MRPRCERSPLPRPANDAIFCLALAQERRMRRGIERHSRTRNRSSEKIAVKSQDVGKQISRYIVMQQNPAAAQQEIRFCTRRWSASLPISTTLMEV